jgi:predicted Rossmann fold nucleotide-binding protein DprA/Smf involved in DNA uptake
MVQRIEPDDGHYPAALKQYRYSSNLPTLKAIATQTAVPTLLSLPKLAIVGSQQCAPELVTAAVALAQQLRDVGVCTISGFHTPVEKDCGKVLIAGTQPMIYCPARSIETLTLSQDQQAAIAHQRLLILSTFPPSQKRMTAALAQRRNQFVTALADALLILHAKPGSKTEALVKTAIAWEKPCWTMPHPSHDHLLQLGVRSLPTLPNSALLF